MEGKMSVVRFELSGLYKSTKKTSIKKRLVELLNVDNDSSVRIVSKNIDTAIVEVESELLFDEIYAKVHGKLFHPGRPFVVSSQQLTVTKSTSNKNKSRSKVQKEAKKLAPLFYKHVLETTTNPQLCLERTELGTMFGDFHTGGTRFLECCVMARLRRLKLLKTKRCGETVKCWMANENKQFMVMDESPVEQLPSFEMVRRPPRVVDEELDAVLQPTSKYVKSQRQYDPTPNEVLPPPPKVDRRQGAENPFKNLPRYNIPEDIKDLLVTDELANCLERPTSMDDYAQFWGKLLWAHEHQALRDIRRYDMENAKLVPEGRYLKLSVPGLAEGRPSVLRGDLVKIVYGQNQYHGRVNAVLQTEVLLEFHPSFHKKYNPSVESVKVRFTFSRTSLRTSHHGVAAAIQLPECILFPDTHHGIDHTKASTTSESKALNYANRTLNDEQKRAVERVVAGDSRPMPYLIWGCPGSGKTTTLVESVFQLVKTANKKVLVVAPSNDACDVLIEKLSVYFPPSEMRRLLAYSRSVSDLPEVAQKYASEDVDSSEVLDKIDGASIVVCTISYGARLGAYGVPQGYFKVLCVDEAGQSTEPEVVSVISTLVCFQRGPVGQVILVGDPKQLGPIVSSDVCCQFGMTASYMERLSLSETYATKYDGAYPYMTKLVRNYRSHPSILKVPNELFYEGELVVAGDHFKTHGLSSWEHLPKKGFPVMFVSVSGENLREANSPSWFNPQEVMEAVHCCELLAKESKPSVSQADIGVVTPYSRQAQKIRSVLEKKNLPDIKVGSVETFQGQERRCIILSTVRSETTHVANDALFNLGFIANEKRFNVAVTRASSLLIVIGDANVLSSDKKTWLPFLRYCHDNSAWIGEPWEFTPEEDTSFEMLPYPNPTPERDEFGLLEDEDELLEDEDEFGLLEDEEEYLYEQEVFAFRFGEE